MEKECILTPIKTSTFVKNITVFSILLGFVICVLFVVFNAFFVGDQIFVRGTTFSTQNIFISLLIIAFGPFIIGLDIAILSFIFCILFNLSIRISGGISYKISEENIERAKTVKEK